MAKSNSIDELSRESERIKRLRLELGFSQREMAEDFGVTSGAIALWESGQRSVPGPVLKLLELYENELGLNQSDEARLDSEVREFSTTRLARAFDLSVTANSIAIEWLKLVLSQVISIESDRSTLRQKSYTLMAEKLATRLTGMKGLASKTFQILYQFHPLLPPEAASAFSKFNSIASPMSQKTVASIVSEELGATPAKVFAHWRAKPLAAASIGQVHLARLHNGEKVAVKIQYPKIVDALESDLKSLETIITLCSFFLRGQDKSIIFREFANRFQEECDYVIEARNQQEFRDLYEGRPEIVIPKVYPNYSTSRLLVTEYWRAKSFRDFAQTASPSQRNLAGRTIWKFAYESILRFGIFQADPQPANFRFLEDRVIFLDFGCVTRFDARFLELFRRWLRSHLEKNRDVHRDVLIELGIAPVTGSYDFDAHFNAGQLVLHPMLVDVECKFSSEQIIRGWRAYFVESPNRKKFNHSREWVFQLRLVWGLTFVLAELGAKANWRRMLLELIEGGPCSRLAMPLQGSPLTAKAHS